MFVGKAKLSIYFKNMLEYYGFAGKPLQWQIGFRCGLEAAAISLFKQIDVAPDAMVASKRLFFCETTGQSYQLVCFANTLDQCFSQEMVVLMHIDSGGIITVPKDLFDSNFK